MSKKDLILDNLNMKDILNKYGIKTEREMFCCPFHNDKSPSAKYYEKTYYCFGCGATGDLIQFIQDYFKIDFLIAMEKINEDFNLGISSNKKINKKEIEHIKLQRLLKKMDEENKIRRHRKKMIEICNLEKILKDTYKQLKNNINPYNWEETEFVCGIILEEIELLDYEFQMLNIKKRH